MAHPPPLNRKAASNFFLHKNDWLGINVGVGVCVVGALCKTLSIISTWELRYNYSFVGVVVIRRGEMNISK